MASKLNKYAPISIFRLERCTKADEFYALDIFWGYIMMSRRMLIDEGELASKLIMSYLDTKRNYETFAFSWGRD